MDDIYCIYTNKLTPYSETNVEHIIPLSLGGCNSLTLRVNQEMNSKLGHHIDGRLSNDYIISSIRRNKNYRGHSNDIPKTILKKTRIEKTNKPIQIVFQGKESHFYDPIENKIIPNSEIIGLSFNSTIKIDKYSRILFIAKTLLSAGYFIYGDIFKNHADHDSLRKLMNYQLTETDETIQNLPLGLVDPLYSEDNDMRFIKFTEAMCESMDCSCVIFLYTTNSIIGSVAIGGSYIGSINFKADTIHFPNENKFNCGHIVGVQDNLLRRSSFNYIASRLTNKYSC